MKEHFDYTRVPKNYLHCLQTQCPRSTDCLRYKVARHATPQIVAISIVNPAYIAGREDNCPCFQEDRQECFALGITHLFDNLPYAQALRIKRMLHYHFHRTTYYRIQRKERHISPKEQSLIREVFRNEGINDEPVFDELEYGYIW